MNTTPVSCATEEMPIAISVRRRSEPVKQSMYEVELVFCSSISIVRAISANAETGEEYPRRARTVIAFLDFF